MQLIVKLLEFSVFDIVSSGKFGNLLGHKGDVILILCGKTFLLNLNFMEACMQIFELSGVEIARLFNPVKQRCNSLISFLDLVMQLVQTSLKVFLLLLSQPFLFLEEALNLIFICIKCINDLLVSLL
jgi:hypothetical protein